MKKLSLLVALMLIITVGGVYATWNYSQGSISQTQGFVLPKMEVAVPDNPKGTIEVCRDGAGIEFDEDIAKTILLENEITIDIALSDGEAEATAWGCDLTYDYVKINGDYRS